MFAKIAKFIRNWNDVLEIAAMLIEISVGIILMLAAGHDETQKIGVCMVAAMLITLLLFAFILPRPELPNDL